MSKQYDYTWEGGGIFPKKYTVEISAEGTIDQIVMAVRKAMSVLKDEDEVGELNSTQDTYYEDNVVLVTLNEL